MPYTQQSEESVTLAEQHCFTRRTPRTGSDLESGKIGTIFYRDSASALNITFLQAPVAGQVLQRRYAYDFLSDHIKVVVHFDDDITLEKGLPDIQEQMELLS